MGSGKGSSSMLQQLPEQNQPFLPELMSHTWTAKQYQTWKLNNWVILDGNPSLFLIKAMWNVNSTQMTSQAHELKLKMVFKKQLNQHKCTFWDLGKDLKKKLSPGCISNSKNMQYQGKVSAKWENHRCANRAEQKCVCGSFTCLPKCHYCSTLFTDKK